MKKEIAEKILNETEIGYDAISKKFSQTRKHFWRGLEFIKYYTHQNDCVLDFGCGNGRLFELVAQTVGVKYLGVDVSEKLINLAKEKYVYSCHSERNESDVGGRMQSKNLGSDLSTSFRSAELNSAQDDTEFHGSGKSVCFQKINPNQSTIALEDDFFNTIYSIAVFHHFPSEKYRQDIARELFRATKSGGHVVVTVWYLWPSFALLRRGKQKKYFKNILKNWINKLKGKSSLDWNDCLISFTDNSGLRVERFHHAFTKKELQKLFEQTGFETEKCEVVDGRNILYIGKKG